MCKKYFTAAVESKPTVKTADEEKLAIAKKLTAALVAQGKTDVSKEELETLVNYYYEQRKAKETTSNETANVASPPKTETITSSVSEPSPGNSEPVEPAIDLTDDQNDTKRDEDEGFDLPQDASSALESLTDNDLQTLLQNFEDLSSDEQKHLHTYMKKLEASNPARVEKLRKYLNIAFDLSSSTLNDRSDKRSPTDRMDMKTMDSKSESRVKRKTDPFNDMFYDDTQDEKTKLSTIVDSDDDDDYSYDDLCKAASKNIKEQQRELHNRKRSPDVLSDTDSVHRHDQFILGGERSNFHDDLSNASRASGDNSNSRATLNDTGSIIANLMGSFQKNVQNRNLSDRQQMDNDVQMQRQHIQSNVPFYLQQQQQQSQSSYAMANAKSTNQMYSNDFNFSGSNGHFAASSNQYNNTYGNQNQSYGNSQQRVNIISNIPLNIPTYAQQQQNQQQQQSSGLTSQQAALLAQLSQQNRRQQW